MGVREFDARFVQEPLEATGLPQFAGARVRSVRCQLRRDKNGIHPGLGHLLRNALTVYDIALQRRAVTVQKNHHERRPPQIEAARNVHEHAAVAVGPVFPVNLAAGCTVPPPAPIAHIEKRPARTGIDAVIGERRVFKFDELRPGMPQREERRLGFDGRSLLYHLHGHNERLEFNRFPALGRLQGRLFGRAVQAIFGGPFVNGLLIGERDGADVLSHRPGALCKVNRPGFVPAAASDDCKNRHDWVAKVL